MKKLVFLFSLFLGGVVFGCPALECYNSGPHGPIATDSLILNETVLDVRIIADDLRLPWEIQWGPDQKLWATLRDGQLVRFDLDTDTRDTLLNLEGSLFEQGENGLLGFAFDPDWSMGERYIYLAYTVANPPSAVYGFFYVARYEYVQNQLINPQVLVGPLTAFVIHSGSRLLFLEDKSLLITSGDANFFESPLNLDSLNGKVLRINRDGSFPADNPFGNSPVYSYGHRNAQGLFLLPDGRIFSSEHGPDSDDELNVILSGKNYGWPLVRGFCDTPAEQDYCNQNEVIEPEIAWTPTLAVSDLIYYDHPAIPEWNGSLLMTTLKEMDLRQIPIDPQGVSGSESTWFDQRWGRLRDVCMGPDGSIFIAANHFQGSSPHVHNQKIIQLIPREKVIPLTDELKVWQNQGVLHVENRNTTNPVRSFQVSDFTGKVVFNTDGESGELPPSLAGGVYFIQVVYNNSEGANQRFYWSTDY